MSGNRRVRVGPMPSPDRYRIMFAEAHGIELAPIVGDNLEGYTVAELRSVLREPPYSLSRDEIETRIALAHAKGVSEHGW